MSIGSGAVEAQRLRVEGEVLQEWVVWQRDGDGANTASMREELSCVRRDVASASVPADDPGIVNFVVLAYV